MRTQLGAAFEQLSAERDRLERVLEQLNEGVLAVDRGLRVQFANANAKLLLAGVPLEKGAPLPETHEGLPLRRLAEGLFVPRASVAEARSQREDGAMISLVGVPASSSDLVVLVFADITEQERRRQAEREFVTQRLARAAHAGDRDHERRRGARSPARRTSRSAASASSS